MLDLLAIFEELKEKAEQKIEIEQNAVQIIVVRTNKNSIYLFVNYRMGTEETQFINSLLEKKDTIITELLCMWNSNELDVPSMNFRKMLMDLHPDNKKAKLLLQGSKGYIIKELSMLV